VTFAELCVRKFLILAVHAAEPQSWHEAVPEPEAPGPCWAQLEPALMPLICEWLAPQGTYGWRDSSGALHNAEPICAALNLYMLLFLRAAKTPGFMPGATLLATSGNVPGRH